MNIREQEDKLFDQWKKKHVSFVIDGCPMPDVYSSQDRKVIFVLKDGNLGESDKNDIYDQRHELENKPTLWWSTIATWCYFLQNPNSNWNESKKICNSDSIKINLSRHCIIQLKKTWGEGSVSNNNLYEFVQSDKEEIITQLSIYKPDFVIACGNGGQLSKVFNCNNSNRKQTSNGIGYWNINLNKSCYLIDYCHPSIRVGTKVKGLIAKGLPEALLEIEQNA
jgi:hypothetical protein